jgi:hypothetical protein
VCIVLLQCNDTIASQKDGLHDNKGEVWQYNIDLVNGTVTGVQVMEVEGHVDFPAM